MSHYDELQAQLLAAAEEDLRRHPLFELTPQSLDDRTIRAAAIADIATNEWAIRNLKRIQDAIGEDVPSVECFAPSGPRRASTNF
ncbi:MAG TPA: hypothetical protein VFC51_12230 [Chloroflexota bacterium]|nr:hypothetical protein [Chloroflexota bacterium]